MAAVFEDAGFLAIGAVGDFAVREMFEELAARRVPLAVALGRQCLVDVSLRIALASQSPRQWHRLDRQHPQSSGR